MCCPTDLPTIVAFLAGAGAGTAAPLNPAYRYDEFCFYLEDTSAKVLLAPPEGAEDARRAAKQLNIPVYAVEMDAQGNVSIVDAPKGVPVRLPSPRRRCAGAAYQRKHGPAQARAAEAPQYRRLLRQTWPRPTTSRPSDVSLCVMPLFHIHGLVASTLSTFLTGGTVVVPNKFNPMSFWRTVREHGVTWYSCVPTIHQLSVARLSEKPEGIEKLRFVRSCSSALSPVADGEA